MFLLIHIEKHVNNVIGNQTTSPETVDSVQGKAEAFAYLSIIVVRQTVTAGREFPVSRHIVLEHNNG